MRLAKGPAAYLAGPAFNADHKPRCVDLMRRSRTSRSGPQARFVQPATPEDCLRRAALAEGYAARTELDIAHNRLLEFAGLWRDRARVLEEARSFLEEAEALRDVDQDIRDSSEDHGECSQRARGHAKAAINPRRSA